MLFEYQTTQRKELHSKQRGLRTPQQTTPVPQHSGMPRASPAVTAPADDQWKSETQHQETRNEAAELENGVAALLVVIRNVLNQ